MKWRSAIRWTTTVVALLLLSATVGGYSYLKSQSFREYVLRTLEQRADEATGGRSEIGNLDFELSTLTAHLYAITLHGSEKPGQEPLLRIDKLTVGLKLASVWHRQVILSQLVIEHPAVNIRVEADGSSNLPSSGQQATSHSSVFDLGVRHLVLANGEVAYKDEKVPLDADLLDLNTEVRFDPSARRYDASISYHDGRLIYFEHAFTHHSLRAQLSATPSALVIESAVWNIESSAVSVRGELADYVHPKIDGTFDLRLRTQDFAALSKNVSSAGEVSSSGKFHYQGKGNQPSLRCVSIEGQVASRALAASSSRGHIELRTVQGSYRFADGSLHASNLRADTLGGTAIAQIDVQHLDAAAVIRVEAAVRDISLSHVQQAIAERRLRSISLAGKLDGTLEAKWTGEVSNMQATLDMDITPDNRFAAPSPATVPLDGSIHATYDGRRSSVTSRQSTLRIASANLTADGELGNRSRLQVQANTTDIQQLQKLAAAIIPTISTIPTISGSASLRASVQGSIQQPNISGQVDASNLQVKSSQWKSVNASFHANPSHISLEDGSLISAHQGKAAFGGNVQLRKWSYMPSDPLTVRLSVQRMSVFELQQLANVRYPFSGDLTADVSVHGSQEKPVGTGSVQIAHGRAYDETIQQLEARFRADQGTVTSALAATLAAGSANANISYTPRTKQFNLQMTAPSVALQKLHAVQARNLPLSGTLRFSARGEGTFENPQLYAVLDAPELQLQKNNSMSDVRAELHVANRMAEIALNSRMAQSSVRAHGQVQLTGGYETNAAIDTTNIPLETLLATYMPAVPEGLKGQTEFHATLAGPLKDKSQVEAHLTVPVLTASYQSLEIAAASPILASYSHSVISIQPAEIRGTGTALRVQGNIPLAGQSRANLTARGSVDMRVLRIFQPDLKSSGTVSLDVRASGSAQNPDFEGTVNLQNVNLLTPTAPLGLEQMNGRLDIGSDRLKVSSLTAQVGGGQISVGGSIIYRPELQFNLVLQSQSVRLRYPEGLRMVLGGNLVLAGNKNESTLGGNVLIESLSFTQDFDLAKFGEQFGGSTVPAQPGFEDTVRLALRVQSTENLSATSSEVSLEGRANLQITGTAANPVLTGRTDLSAGELFYRNVRYQLQRGIITFDNPNETRPVLNVSLTTTVEQYNLTLTLRGPIDNLNTSYVSDPPLATADVINLIARGKTTQESDAAGQSTDSMIASQAASQLSSGLQNFAGLSSLQIDPLVGGNNQNPSARIAVQQRVTKNFLFTFSTDVSQPGSEIVQGDYQINRRWSVSVARDESGGVSVDGKFHKSF